MKLLVVDYAEQQSMWVGETPKNIAAIFRAASEQTPVLLFDEADAIADTPFRRRHFAYDVR